MQYVRAWLGYIENDPRGGTIGSIYRAVLYAINSRPFMAAMMRRDRRLLGGYLRKPNNLFAALQSDTLWVDTLRVLQEAEMVRQDVNPAVIAQILNLIAYGLVNVYDVAPPEQTPAFDTASSDTASSDTVSSDLVSFDTVMETIAQIMDKALTPENGGDRAAAKAVIHRLGKLAEQKFTEMDEARHSPRHG